MWRLANDRLWPGADTGCPLYVRFKGVEETRFARSKFFRSDPKRSYAVPQRCDTKDRLVDPIVDALSDMLGQGQADLGERRPADGEIDLLGRCHRQICRICPTEDFVNIARGSREAFLVARPD